MWNQKFALALSKSIVEDEIEQLRLIKEAGFDGYFPCWSRDKDLTPIIEEGNRLGLILQSIHAPFKNVKALWEEDEAAAEDALSEQLECLRDCARFGAPIMVVHVFIGFKDHKPTQIGIQRYSVIVKEAEKLGVKVAFENTEGEEYLEALMLAFRSSPAVGFCWDTGHEMCYNRSRDMLALYGDKLICTHINDNLGIKDFRGEITYRDDLHLLPFDGIADWDDIAARLDKCGFDGIMTFELTRLSKKERHDNDIYAAMTATDYLAECFKRACRVAAKRRVHQKNA
ncbi:MAG: sugar phosphate isomerase/epimerase [Clostridia bacterium]|nr:sugar phosphate isomerase/epimerase [Clostridia bacterium]